MEKLIWWTGATILAVGGWAVIAALAYVALEYTLKTAGVTRMLLQWKWDKLRAERGQIITKKRDARAAAPHG